MASYLCIPATPLILCERKADVLWLCANRHVGSAVQIALLDGSEPAAGGGWECMAKVKAVLVRSMQVTFSYGCTGAFLSTAQHILHFMSMLGWRQQPELFNSLSASERPSGRREVHK